MVFLAWSWEEEGPTPCKKSWEAAQEGNYAASFGAALEAGIVWEFSHELFTPNGVLEVWKKEAPSPGKPGISASYEA